MYYFKKDVVLSRVVFVGYVIFFDGLFQYLGKNNENVKRG